MTAPSLERDGGERESVCSDAEKQTMKRGGEEERRRGVIVSKIETCDRGCSR